MRDFNLEAKVSDLLGKTLSQIIVKRDENERIFEITFITREEEKYFMYHSQDCCECVSVEDINGDLDDLLGYPLLQAEESTNKTDTLGLIEYPESFTWTFYKFATIKGYVTIRWLGESNGYYSEEVEFMKEEANEIQK